MGIIPGTFGAPLHSAGAPGAGTDSVQTLTIGGTPTGGSFRLRLGSFISAAIAWTAVDATLVAAIDAALEAMPGIGVGNVVVADTTLTSGIGDVTITFGGALAKRAIPVITVESNNLTGTSPTVAVVDTTPGVDAFGIGSPKGALAINDTDGDLFSNTGTPALPVWTVTGAQS